MVEAKVAEWEATAVASKVVVGAAAGAAHMQRLAVTVEEEKDTVSANVG